MESIGILTDNNGFLSLDGSFLEYLRTERFLTDKILERIVVALKDDDLFYELFCPQNLSFDIVYHAIQVSNSAFRFQHSSFKQLLIDFGFLEQHPDRKIRKYIINPRYRKLFDGNLLGEIRSRRIGIDELRKQLSQKQIYGEEAEKFVLAYETKRLLSQKSPEWISPYSVDAGYDILSFDEISSGVGDRFIEVKSYVGSPSFYWSRNEMDVARIKKESYFLYLIDRDRMSEENYVPFMIQDPYSYFEHSTEWNGRVEKIYYYIESSLGSHD